MIIRKSTAKAKQWRFGQSGETVEALPEDFGAFLLGLSEKPQVPISALPLIQHNLARVGILGSARVVDGFKWHNTCLELEPANWQSIIDRMKPDYLLIESCFYDSARAWPLLPFDAQNIKHIYLMIVRAARKAGVPSIFWYTLGPDNLPYFIDVLPIFDIVGCADDESCEILRKRNIEYRLLPYAFSPEQFNPLTNPRMTPKSDNLLFDGIASMMRFPYVRSELACFANLDLTIIDTGMLTSEYNLRRFYDHHLTAKVIGNVSQTRVQDVYKNSGAYLSLGKNTLPVYQWRALEAAACRLPVLHTGLYAGFMSQFAEIFKNPDEAADRWRELHQNPLARDRAGHLAWRKTHQEHTFAKRIAQIHRWLNLPGEPFPMPKATIITPSIRKKYFARALVAYESQTWPNKEFIYIFNGSLDDMPRLPENTKKDIKIIGISPDHAAGMAMNAGIMASGGEYLFKLDDDDLYGANYVADRMIYFREFNVDSLTIARAWFTFGDSGVASFGATSTVPQDNTVAALGSMHYKVMTFPGATWAMRKSYARRLGFTGVANAWDDVAFMLKGMFFTPGSAHIKTDSFNFCVKRNDPAEHAWVLSASELKSHLDIAEAPLDELFV